MDTVLFWELTKKTFLMHGHSRRILKYLYSIPTLFYRYLALNQIRQKWSRGWEIYRYKLRQQIENH